MAKHQSGPPGQSQDFTPSGLTGYKNGHVTAFQAQLATGNLNGLANGKLIDNYADAIADGYVPLPEEIQAVLDLVGQLPDAVLAPLLLQLPATIFDLNHENTMSGTTQFSATAGRDVFVYDFENSDGADDIYSIVGFDPALDTMIFVNADASGAGNILVEINRDDLYQEISTEVDGVYEEPNIEAKAVAATGNPSAGTNTLRTFEFNWGDTVNEVDTINVTNAANTLLEFTLDYPADDLDPLARTVAHVYQDFADFI